ncbi:hypothetical protein FXO37_26761 [Capsicum annuum]|nr:hypothetical protein FXO37_26761 [Capsicum annuum]
MYLELNKRICVNCNNVEQKQKILQDLQNENARLIEEVRMIFNMIGLDLELRLKCNDDPSGQIWSSDRDDVRSRNFSRLNWNYLNVIRRLKTLYQPIFGDFGMGFRLGRMGLGPVDAKGGYKANVTNEPITLRLSPPECQLALPEFDSFIRIRFLEYVVENFGFVSEIGKLEDKRIGGRLECSRVFYMELSLHISETRRIRLLVVLLDRRKRMFSKMSDPEDHVREQLSQSDELELDPMQIKIWFDNKRCHIQAQRDMEEREILLLENERLHAENLEELKYYLRQPIEGCRARINALDWWKNNKRQYPMLSILARDILNVPMSPVASESAFSQGRQQLGDNRHSLGSNAMNVLVCLRDWIRAECRNQEMEVKPKDEKNLEKILTSRENSAQSSPMYDFAPIDFDYPMTIPVNINMHELKKIMQNL